MTEEPTNKKCSKCKQSKDISNFAKNKHNPKGLDHLCSSCRSMYNRMYLQTLRRNKPESYAQFVQKKSSYNHQYYLSRKNKSEGNCNTATMERTEPLNCLGFDDPYDV